MKHGSNHRRGGRSRNNNNDGRRFSTPGYRHSNFESAGPDVKIRGTAQQVLEKYLALARDAASAGDRIAAENFLQHAEHYYRIINLNNPNPNPGPNPNPNQQQQGNGGNRPSHGAQGTPAGHDGGNGMDSDDDEGYAGNQAQPHPGNGNQP